MSDFDREIVAGFFAAARERYRIMLAKESGQPWPWTEDETFLHNRFTCVHREDDKTTRWFRENVRDVVEGDDEKMLKAVVAFRFFNRIETGERILPLLTGTWNGRQALKLIKQAPALKQIVTGSYIIRGQIGMPKAEGVCWAIDHFPFKASEVKGATLQRAHWLINHAPFVGGFMAYEFVSDLRWTSLLNPTDALTWCHLGPGATRGLGRLLHGDKDAFSQGSGQAQMLEICQQILWIARTDTAMWPAEWRAWEMREVEHWLCEYDKYVRASTGDGRMKRRYRP